MIQLLLSLLTDPVVPCFSGHWVALVLRIAAAGVATMGLNFVILYAS
jgi:hypothetical protein